MSLIIVVANDTNPLKLEAALNQTQDCFEAMAQALCHTSVHPSPRCSDLHKFYGGLFRCPKYSCIHFHTGFDTLAARDKHGLKHERMFKCTEEQCDFSFLGFQSKSELKEHLSMHFNQTKQFDLGTNLQSQDSSFFNDALNLAAEAGDIALVRDMLTKCKVMDASFWSSLYHSAAKSGSEELVLYLLDPRHDKTHPPFPGHLWLVAAEYSLEGVVAQLIEYGCDYPLGKRYGNPLQEAVAHGSEAIVVMCLENGADIEESAEVGFTRRSVVYRPLHRSVISKNEAMVRLLLDRGADVNSVVSNETALHLAARLGLHDIVETLLDYGANVNKGNKDETPVNVASRKGFKMVVQLLMSRGALLAHSGRSSTTLHSAVREVGASKEVIAFLLEQGLELDAKTDTGETPLHCAAKHSSEEVVEYLLLLGADPNLRSNGGLVPLHMTVSSASHVLTPTKTLTARTLKIIQLLAEKTDDEAKHYALWIATSSPSLYFKSDARKNFCRAFISAGADPLTMYADGRTLLFAGYRAFTNDRTHVEFLLSLGVSTKVVDAHGNSVLHQLASAFAGAKIPESERRTFRVILETLIAAGADLRVVNFNSEVAGDVLRAIGFDFPDVQH